MGLEPSMYGLRGQHSSTSPTRHIIVLLLIVTYYKLLSKMCLAYFLTRSYGKIPQCELFWKCLVLRGFLGHERFSAARGL